MAKSRPAATVLSPKDCVRNVKVLFDGGVKMHSHYSVAQLEWNGHPCIGIRWNITERELNNPAKANGTKTCVGEPNSRGYPTWFILPDAFLQNILAGGDVAVAIREYLGEE